MPHAGMVREYGLGMERNNRPVPPVNPSVPHPPLTELVEHQTDRSEPPEAESDIPRPTEPGRVGRDDYASGTSEHDDDREV